MLSGYSNIAREYFSISSLKFFNSIEIKGASYFLLGCRIFNRKINQQMKSIDSVWISHSLTVL